MAIVPNKIIKNKQVHQNCDFKKSEFARECFVAPYIIRQ